MSNLCDDCGLRDCQCVETLLAQVAEKEQRIAELESTLRMALDELEDVKGDADFCASFTIDGAYTEEQEERARRLRKKLEGKS